MPMYELIFCIPQKSTNRADRRRRTNENQYRTQRELTQGLFTNEYSLSFECGSQGVLVQMVKGTLKNYRKESTDKVY